MASIAVRNRKSRRSEELASAFAAKYPDYQYRFVDFIVEHLVDIGRPFGGDLQQVLVLAVIGQVHIRADRERQAGRSAGPLEAGIAASRIADVTGIPRETVRRKLTALERRGWIRRGPDAMWQIAAEGDESHVRSDLAGIDDATVQRVARLVADLEDLA